MRPAIYRLCLGWLIICALGAALPPKGIAEESEKTVWVLRFELGGSRLTGAHTDMLDEVARRLLEDPRSAALVVGHSDNQGSESANLQVSRLRAEAVRDYLTGTRGIGEPRISVEARGSRKPVASNDTPEGRLRNRRVVVALRETTAAASRRQARTWILYFDQGGSDLSTTNITLLGEVAQELRLHPGLAALIVGHSDNSGQEPINLQVSLARAEAARRHLVERHGIDEARIRTQGKGSQRPVAANDTPEGQRRNRRAVIVLKDPLATAAEPPRAEAQAPVVEAAASTVPLPAPGTPAIEETGPEAVLEPPSTQPQVAPAPPSDEPHPAPTLAAAQPPPTSEPVSLLKAGPGVTPPALLELPRLVLADTARGPEREVAVTVAVLVSEKGRVLLARVDGARRVKGRFRAAAVEAAKRARFEPATRAGETGRMWVNLVVVIPARP